MISSWIKKEDAKYTGTFCSRNAGIMANAISAEVIGYMLMGVLVLMSIIRTILFCRMDARGGKAVLVTKIKEYRENTDMKQAELAELVKARRETIVHLENGKYNP